jgi:hypothetical protein
LKQIRRAEIAPLHGAGMGTGVPQMISGHRPVRRVANAHRPFLWHHQDARDLGDLGAIRRNPQFFLDQVESS